MAHRSTGIEQWSAERTANKIPKYLPVIESLISKTLLRENLEVNWKFLLKILNWVVSILLECEVLVLVCFKNCSSCLKITHLFSLAIIFCLKRALKKCLEKISKAVKQGWVTYGIYCTFACNIRIQFRGSNIFYSQHTSWLHLCILQNTSY